MTELPPSEPTPPPPKVYAREIENMGEDTYELMAIGHRDPDAFMIACREAHPSFFPMGKPRHLWMRKKRKRGYTFWMEPADGPEDQSAIPVTWTSEGWGDALYRFPGETS